MAAATVTERLEVNDPNVEVVVLTATDTNTYTSRKFGNVRAVQATLMQDATTLAIPLSCDISGSTITINSTGLTSLKVCLTIYGRM
ncbi:MAG TPA: hypothetical protein ENI61_05335 [Ignavibacteria bacterium]|nr:hypothetical protein [Ignavibacteria bacterium]